MCSIGETEPLMCGSTPQTACSASAVVPTLIAQRFFQPSVDESNGSEQVSERVERLEPAEAVTP
jgi:hypothetical protein